MEAPEQNMPGSGTQIKTSGDVTITEHRHSLPETGKERTVIIVLFVLLVISLTINCLNYARMGRNDEKLLLAEERATQAEKGVQTEAWADADSLSKENAQIRGEVIAIENLIQSYGIVHSIDRPDPLPPRLRKEKHH